MLDHCKINKAQQSCNNVASSEHGAPHRSCCSLTRMSRPATGKKTPGELSAGDWERNPSKQFQDCFLRSQHSATIYPERFQEQRIVDRARGPVRAAAAIVVEAADGGGRRRGGHLGLVLQQQRRGRQRRLLAGWPARITGLTGHGPRELRLRLSSPCNTPIRPSPLGSRRLLPI